MRQQHYPISHSSKWKSVFYFLALLILVGGTSCDFTTKSKGIDFLPFITEDCNTSYLPAPYKSDVQADGKYLECQYVGIAKDPEAGIMRGMADVTVNYIQDVKAVRENFDSYRVKIQMTCLKRLRSITVNLSSWLLDQS